MAKKKPGPKKGYGGRPRKKLDWKIIEGQATVGATQEEIAAYFECDPDTLCRHCKKEYDITFAEYLEQKRGVGNVALRRKQMQAALAGSETMLIWLGKNKLGQSNKLETKNEHTINSFSELVKETLSKIDDDTK